jgi:uracil-DNA glycosylase family 4
MNAAADLAAIAAEIRTHAGCGFEVCLTCRNFVPGEGDPAADVVIVGEAPGATEDAEGRPFVGRAGQLLDLVLAEAGLRREEVWITNVVKARPPGNRDPKAGEVDHYLAWLQRELAAIAPRLVVPVGRHALARFAPAARISEAHGRLVAGDPPLFPLYHPAAALRSTQLRATLFADARTLGEILRSPAPSRGSPS